jgi:hypothetical protein
MSYSVPNRLDYLGSRFAQVNSELVKYVIPGVIEITDLHATLGNTRGYETSDNAVLEVHYQDFILETALLVDGVTPFLPERGHYIERANGDKYYVTPVRSDDRVPQAVFRYTTPSELRIRIHTLQGG